MAAITWDCDPCDGLADVRQTAAFRVKRTSALPPMRLSGLAKISNGSFTRRLKFGSPALLGDLNIGQQQPLDPACRQLDIAEGGREHWRVPIQFSFHASTPGCEPYLPLIIDVLSNKREWRRE
jgi:hypothetical protein